MRGKKAHFYLNLGGPRRLASMAEIASDFCHASIITFIGNGLLAGRFQ